MNSFYKNNFIDLSLNTVLLLFSYEVNFDNRRFLVQYLIEINNNCDMIK